MSSNTLSPVATVIDPTLTFGPKQMAATLSISRATLDRLESAGKIGPAPVRLGGRKIYVRSEVEAWLAAPRDGRGELPDRRMWQAMRAARQRTA